uniref:Cytochrome P450 724B1 n=1 Tax=Kalanchoe fedtschenkoi TaxID=63787 RepID=A0A7N0TTY6_KALFE
MDGTSGLLVTVLFVGVIAYVFSLVFNHYKPLLHNLVGAGGGCKVPNGSFGWPLLGETLSFLKPHASNSVGSFLQDHCSRYGKVFKSHLFLTPTIVSCDQDLNYFILQNEDKLFQCSYPKPIHGILGDISMLVAVGDTHKRLRSAALALVSSTKSKPGFLADIENTVIKTIGSWKQNTQVLFCEEARRFTFTVIVKQVLGLSPDDPVTHRILKDFLTFMKGLISLPVYIPGTPYARAVKARIRISSTVKAIIEERIKRNKEAQPSTATSRCNDFLETLVSIDTLSEDEKVSFVLDSLLGGYETTSLLMSLIVYFLAQSPAAVELLKVEHEKIGSMKKEGEVLSWDDYRKMEFTQKVINEALRCGNVVKFVHRKALKDIKFRDFIIPCGWKVLPVFSAVHLDSSLHENALEFQPLRWDQNQDQTCKTFTPFGGGTRCCPGFELAKVEVAFFLHHLVQKYRWRLSEPGEQPLAYPYIEFQRGLSIEVEQC